MDSIDYSTCVDHDRSTCMYCDRIATTQCDLVPFIHSESSTCTDHEKRICMQRALVVRADTIILTHARTMISVQTWTTNAELTKWKHFESILRVCKAYNICAG